MACPALYNGGRRNLVNGRASTFHPRRLADPRASHGADARRQKVSMQDGGRRNLVGGRVGSLQPRRLADPRASHEVETRRPRCIRPGSAFWDPTTVPEEGVPWPSDVANTADFSLPCASLHHHRCADLVGYPDSALQRDISGIVVHVIQSLVDRGWNGWIKTIQLCRTQVQMGHCRGSPASV